MNLKTAKRVRKALAYHPYRHTTTYEQPQVHHLTQHPQFETHQRTIRELHRPDITCPRYYNAERIVTKIRYDRTGKTPLRPLLNSAGEQMFEVVPVAKPIWLKAGSPRRVYKLMKRLERTIGLDNVFKQLADESGVPA